MRRGFCHKSSDVSGVGLWVTSIYAPRLSATTLTAVRMPRGARELSGLVARWAELVEQKELRWVWRVTVGRRQLGKVVLHISAANLRAMRAHRIGFFIRQLVCACGERCAKSSKACGLVPDVGTALLQEALQWAGRKGA